jgi:hypothetical protein
MAVGPGNYWFVHGTNGDTLGGLTIHANGKWDWSGHSGGPNSGTWVTAGAHTIFTAKNGVKVCVYANAGDIDFAAPWRGGNLNGYGYLTPK